MPTSEDGSVAAPAGMTFDSPTVYSGTDMELAVATAATESQLFQALPVQVNTTTSLVSVLSGTSAALQAGTYKVTISYGWSHDAQTSDFICRFLWGGAALTNHGGGLLHRQEPKDSAGGNISGTGTDQNHPVTKVYYVTAAENDEPTFDVSIQSGSGGVEASIWDLSVAVEWFSA